MSLVRQSEILMFQPLVHRQRESLLRSLLTKSRKIYVNCVSCWKKYIATPPTRQEMRHLRREPREGVTIPPSEARCYLAMGMGGCIAAALLGLTYEQHAVWAASLACFALLCVQGACGAYFSRERVVVVQITAPLSRTTL